MFYVLLSTCQLTGQHQVDFSFSSSELTLSTGTAPSAFQFISDRSQAPKGAAVVEWSDAIRRFIKQWD
jgi:hypothetical protein